MKFLILVFALMSLFNTTLAGSGGGDPSTCKEASLQCGGGNPGGGVFSCVKDPIPTCTWANAVTGFEIPGTLVAADVKKKSAVASTASIDSKTDDTTEVETADDTTPYYNICSPCIRHNDYCKSKCDWQGKACDLKCNQHTSSTNLITGDWHQPTVSCGRFCKWPCH
ncbi:hypothetical protein E8E11_010692 [Didymella keratinophila]|nr:hypothetical protein E8E11_010692 [Didymella keratinophila]